MLNHSVLDWSEFHVWSHLWADVAKTSKKSFRRRTKSFGASPEDVPEVCKGCETERTLVDRFGLVIPSVFKRGPRQERFQDDYHRKTAAHAAYVQFSAGALGGGTATYCTHWLDTLKVKMQAFPGHYPTTTRCLKQTLQHEGVRGLYQGAMPAVVGHATKASIVFMSYGICEEFVRELADKSDTKQLSVSQHASAGAMTGIVASFVLCPLELIKCRMQALQQLSCKSKNVKSTGSMAMARSILRQEGVRGLYRGLNGMWVKEIPGSFIYFGSYEAAKNLVRDIKQSPDLNGTEVFMCGIGAGLCFSLTHPIESVKTRVQVMSAVDKPQGFLKTTAQIVRTEGVRPLYSGLKPSMLRACSYSGIQFLMYELAKDYLSKEKSPRCNQG